MANATKSKPTKKRKSLLVAVPKWARQESKWWDFGDGVKEALGRTKVMPRGALTTLKRLQKADTAVWKADIRGRAYEEQDAVDRGMVIAEKFELQMKKFADSTAAAKAKR